MLTLHRKTGKPKEEHEVAGALLDLKLEPVIANTGVNQSQVQTIECSDPIESENNRSTQTVHDEQLVNKCSTQVINKLYLKSSDDSTFISIFLPHTKIILQ